MARSAIAGVKAVVERKGAMKQEVVAGAAR